VTIRSDGGGKGAFALEKEHPLGEWKKKEGGKASLLLLRVIFDIPTSEKKKGKLYPQQGGPGGGGVFPQSSFLCGWGMRKKGKNSRSGGGCHECLGGSGSLSWDHFPPQEGGGGRGLIHGAEKRAHKSLPPG